jgi:4,5-DOPA dioxygenase extradiol
MMLPSLFLSHGAPTLPLTDTPARSFLNGLGGRLPRPRAILVVSAHWETESPVVSAVERNDTIHDFYGFPRPLYELTYPAPGAPSLAVQVAELLRAAGLSCGIDKARGLDHGAWVPLLLMYPEADIPVLQLSIQPHLGPAHHLSMGRALERLRDEGVLIIGSGFLTHGLPFLRDFRFDAPPPGWSTEFDHWAAEALDAADIDALVNFRAAPAARYAHPTTEHFAPLFVTLGAAADPAPVTTITGYWLGLAKRSIQVA